MMHKHSKVNKKKPPMLSRRLTQHSVQTKIVLIKTGLCAQKSLKAQLKTPPTMNKFQFMHISDSFDTLIWLGFVLTARVSLTSYESFNQLTNSWIE